MPELPEVEALAVFLLPRVGGRVIARAEAVRTHDGRLHYADIIINAAGSWAGQIRGLEPDKVETHPVRGQMVCFDARPGTLGPSVFSSRGPPTLNDTTHCTLSTTRICARSPR